MKKLILSIATLGVAMSAVNAQDKSVYFAPEAGANMFKVTKLDDIKYALGFKAGVNVLLKAGENFSIAPGVFYSMKGYKIDNTVSAGGTTITNKITQRTGYIEVPVNLQYDFNFDDGSSVFVFAGPYAAFGVNANNGVKFGDDGLKRFDWGFNFGLGYKAAFGGFIRAQYQLGMAKLFKDYSVGGVSVESPSIKNTGFGLSVGYVF